MFTLMATQLSTLYEMLSYCRPHGSPMDLAFCTRYIASLPGVKRDIYGNWIGDIGDSPRVLWSSHTDTVHRDSGRQTLHIDSVRQTIELSRKARKLRNCLGADDTIGVFLMCEMYRAGVPGRYIFHYGEERGCMGSSDIANLAPETLAGIQFAIALDRAGTHDVITTQFGDTCCSEDFAASLIGALGLPYATEHGVFTDTASYMDLVPECTNLSVGYYHQHTRDEYVDFAHVGTLLSALVAMDQSRLVVARDPYAPPPPRVCYPSKVASVSRDTYAPLWDREDSRHDAPPDTYAYGWDQWCVVCDAPVVDRADPDYDDIDHCLCPTPEIDDRDLLDDTTGMSEDDIRFLRHLRGLD